MPATATKNNIKNSRRRINFQSKKKLNAVLIQNDRILVIFWHLQARLQQFWECRYARNVRAKAGSCKTVS